MVKQAFKGMVIISALAGIFWESLELLAGLNLIGVKTEFLEQMKMLVFYSFIGCSLCSIVTLISLNSKSMKDNYVKELYSSEERYKMIFENSPLGIVHFNNNGEITHCNDKMMEILGTSKKELIGFDLFTQINDASMKDALQTALSGRVGYFEGDYTSVTDQKRLSVKAFINSITSPRGDFLGGIGIYEDITEKKQLEKEMVKLDKLALVGQMAAGISHEVRNPMTTVRGFLQIMESKEFDSQKKGYYELMISELDRANSIIKEFLALAKNKSVELTVLDINTILNDLLPLMSEDAKRQEKSLIMNKNLIPKLYLDSREIRQLVLNLVRNGLEAMPAGKDLVISTFEENGEVVLSIEDEGNGIPPEIFEKLGTPFLTTKDAGTGLGLAVCYSIANRHNAKIDIKTGSSGTKLLVRFDPMWRGAY